MDARVPFVLPALIFVFTWNACNGIDSGRALSYLLHCESRRNTSYLLWIYYLFVGLPGIIGSIFLGRLWPGTIIGTITVIAITCVLPYTFWIWYYSMHEEALRGISILPCLRRRNTYLEQNISATTPESNRRLPLRRRSRLEILLTPLENLLIIKRVVAPDVENQQNKSNNRNTKERSRPLETSFRSAHPKSDIICGNVSKPDIFPIQVPVDGDQSVTSGIDKIVGDTSEECPIQACRICLEEYQVGEEIGWSKNRDCHHFFHKNCLLEWLAIHKECPMCRKSYEIDDEEMG